MTDRRLGVRQLVALAGPLALVAVALLMLAWTWRTWSDILIDFGREVYVPWQLASGKVLYRDIAYFNGPLSPYLNSLWFRAFGAQLDVLFAANLCVLAALVALLYRLSRTVSDRLSAFLACFVFLVLFAFAQYDMVGNYNYMAPYSHELTHGLLLSLAGVACVGAYARHRGVLSLLCAGLALGLTFLTKIEIFLAALLATVAGFVVSLHGGQPGRPRRALHVLAFTLAALAPVVVAYLLLSTGMPPRMALDGLVRQFVMVTNRDITTSPFYAGSMGTDDLGGNVVRLLTWLGGYIAVFAPAFVVARFLKPTMPYRRVAAAAMFATTAIVLSLAVRGAHWFDVGRPLPLILLSAAVFAILRVRIRSGGGSPTSSVVWISLLVFAPVLLAKIALYSRLYEYGFALAMPATMLLVVALVGWLPAMVDRLGGYGAAFRAAALGAVLAAGAGQLGTMQARVREKSYTVVAGAGAIRTTRVRGPQIAEVLRSIEESTDPRTSLAVLPEGATVNFLARRVNPTPYINLMPVELVVFGEERMLEAFRATPPDMVLLWRKDVSEYGFRYFGVDYGRAIGDWIRAHYERVAVVRGAPQETAADYGIEVLRYRGPVRSGRGTN